PFGPDAAGAGGRRGMRERHVPRRVECDPADAARAFLRVSREALPQSRLPPAGLAERRKAPRGGRLADRGARGLRARRGRRPGAGDARARRAALRLPAQPAAGKPPVFPAALLVHGFRKGGRGAVCGRREPRQNELVPHAAQAARLSGKGGDLRLKQTRREAKSGGRKETEMKMTGKDLFAALSFVDDALILEAEEAKPARRAVSMQAVRWVGALAACVCVLVG